MAYTSRSGRRPDEHAGRASHQNIINDDVVRQFISECVLPAPPEALDLKRHVVVNVAPISQSPLRHVIAIDGGYTEVILRKEYPSSTMAFFQFGALMFGMADLEGLEASPFILPEQMAKLKNIERFKLALPTRAVVLKGTTSLTHAVRQAIYRFMRDNTPDQPLLRTLKWFLFEEYREEPLRRWDLASCPECKEGPIPLVRANISAEYSFKCPECGKQIMLSDVFRLHEAIDDELGAAGILGYVVTLIEQIIVAHMIRLIVETKPALLNEVLFVKDGPLAFFGQTANMHKPMRSLVRFLFEKHNLFLLGAEKSGAFTDHADAIKDLLRAGSVLLLDNDYIYRYIIPGNADPSRPYGSSTYYGTKTIFKTADGRLHVVTVPTSEHLAEPTLSDVKNLPVLLDALTRLRCDMYENSIVPIALVNKLVSLSDHPSAAILERFAKGTLSG